MVVRHGAVTTPHQTPPPDAHYDAVVVGSGVGGSVMTYRLAEAGLNVCLLERGKAYPPGTFPRSPWETGRNFWDPSEGLHGIWNVWSFGGIGGIVASGLGGGSLVYSNVLLRKDASTFVHDDLETWPVTRDELEPGYERHEQMLAGTPYPYERDQSKRDPALEPYDRTYKTRAMQYAAERLGIEWILPKLAVAFAANGGEPKPAQPILHERENLHGVVRMTCRLCGECNVGCNYGSKNTLDFNYLSDAKLQHGASIFTRQEVKSFEPRQGGGWTVRYVDHSGAVEGEKRKQDPPLRTLTCDKLVLSAGVFGTTFLLLKQRDRLRNLSDRLGSQFSGNGDILMIAMKCLEDEGGTPRIVDPGYGPVITSTMRIPDKAEGGPGRAHYIQDGGHPQIVNWIVESSYQLQVIKKGLRLGVRLVKHWLRLDRRSDIGKQIADFWSPGDLTSSSLPLFSMGRDIPDGKMSLTKDGYLDLDWHARHSNEYFDAVRATGKRIASVLRGKFVDNPSWSLRRVVTVHPLGGCPMGNDASEGVVDSYGRVFGYDDLVIADGSVMPGPVGPNPSNTIAALAHRAADKLIADRR
jgi:cholesterol oxidase